MPRHLGCDLASTRPVTASGTGQPVDTHVVQAGQTVLLMNQPVTAYNGLFTVSEGQWQRHPDFATVAQMEAGTEFFVRGGAEHRFTEWYLENTVGVLEADGLYFRRRSYSTAVRAGGGLEVDEMNATLEISEKLGVQGTYQNPIVSLDARGVATYAESGGFSENLLEGFTVKRLSATSVEVSEGRAWVPGGGGDAGQLLESDDPIVKSGLILPASSWVRLYLWNNGGTPDVEFSTQAPASPYYRNARVKGGPDNTDPNVTPDPSRRLFFELRTNASGQIENFHQRPGGFVQWRSPLGGSPGRIVSGTLNNVVQAFPTTAGAVSPAWPETATALLVRGAVTVNAGESGTYEISGDGDGIHAVGQTATTGRVTATALDTSRRGTDTGPVSLGAARQVLYGFSTRSGSPGSAIDVHGYWEEYD